MAIRRYRKDLAPGSVRELGSPATPTEIARFAAKD
jgi:hypothetical protein